MAVWFIEQELRHGDWLLQTRVSADGMEAEYLSVHTPTDTLQKREYQGETAIQQADRAFDERAIELVHG